LKIKDFFIAEILDENKLEMEILEQEKKLLQGQSNMHQKREALNELFLDENKFHRNKHGFENARNKNDKLFEYDTFEDFYITSSDEEESFTTLRNNKSAVKYRTEPNNANSIDKRNDEKENISPNKFKKLSLSHNKNKNKYKKEAKISLENIKSLTTSLSINSFEKSNSSEDLKQLSEGIESTQCPQSSSTEENVIEKGHNLLFQHKSEDTFDGPLLTSPKYNKLAIPISYNLRKVNFPNLKKKLTQYFRRPRRSANERKETKLNESLKKKDPELATDE